MAMRGKRVDSSSWSVGQQLRCDRLGLTAQIIDIQPTFWGTFITLVQIEPQSLLCVSLSELEQQGWVLNNVNLG